MATLTRVCEDELRIFLAEYSGLGNFVSIVGIPEGSVNSNYAVETTAHRYFLRIYEEQDFDGARTEGETLLHLSSRGVSCEPPLLRHDGQRLGRLAGKPAALFSWSTGTVRCQASVSAADAFQVGAALARIHVAGSERLDGESRESETSGTSADRAGRFGAVQLRTRLEHIARASDPTLAAWAEPLGRALEANEARRHPHLPKGLVHGDLFRDNVLWDDAGNIAILLDFESAFTGSFAFDLAVTVLAWCVGDALSPDLARAMVRGYESVRAFTAEEREALHAEACFGALRFAITRITDFAMRGNTMKDYRRFIMRYESLEQMGPAGLARVLFADDSTA